MSFSFFLSLSLFLVYFGWIVEHFSYIFLPVRYPVSSTGTVRNHGFWLCG